MEAKGAPIINKYLVDAFPFELVPELRELNIGGLAMMVRLEGVGYFGLREPLADSVSGGRLLTTAKPEGDTWLSMARRSGSAKRRGAASRSR